jgi:5-methyltetrahydrofolate--homocysteine methyltransferase
MCAIHQSNGGVKMSKQLDAINDGIMEGDLKAVVENVQAALDLGEDAEKILKEGMIPAMEKVGSLFEEGEYFVPEMLIAARAMQGGLNLLKPRLMEAGIKMIGKVAVGTVQGDLHDIGKNMVAMMLEGAGFEVLDLGVDVSPEKFVESVKAGDVDLVAMSALLTTTMPQMKTTLKALQDAGVRGQVKVMIGGAPVTEAFAQEIGADGFAPDASQATTLAKSLIA